ncbi:hypothetical protein A1_20 [Streptococcus phage A1]|nr:hypothetical protein A1_20 [Streptococcus phage A1]
MYSIDGFKSSERKIYRCSLADDEFRSGRLETFHFVEDNLDDYILRQSTGLFDKNGVETPSNTKSTNLRQRKRLNVSEVN